MLNKRHSFFLALLDRVSMRHPQTAQPDRPVISNAFVLFTSITPVFVKDLRCCERDVILCQKILVWYGVGFSQSE